MNVPALFIVDRGRRADDGADLRDSEVQVWRDEFGRKLATCYAIDGRHWVDVPGVARFGVNRPSNAVEAIAYPSAAPEEIDEVYNDSVLPLVVHVHGVEALHASAVLSPQGVVAFCAGSGTGKSTIARGLSERGYPLWADDAVAVEVSGPVVNVISLPFKARLRPDAASFFAQRRVTGRNGLGSSDPVEGAVPLAAICVLRREPELMDGALVIETLRASSAFLALLEHAYCFSLLDADRKRRMIEHYLVVSARVRILEIRFAAGLEHLSSMLDRIEQTVLQNPE
jgi:hypothetical protein